ncbi:Protein FAR1-RELATED SEQUENCE [Abeliophyllum distichum]|uniref:Protein FAR1-RELATED SEQUENCE n=1 Tax=Abeliophyllum distichum TaxID=126358 RepID=A0ABD1Q7D5_9LAMI
MQQVYTIVKFNEVQIELIEMMFCDVLSWEDEFGGMRYVVREDVVVNESKFTVSYVKDQCQIVHLEKVEKRCAKAYTRVKINYFGWVSTPAQVRYDQLFKTFGKVANLVVDDDFCTQELMEFLENHMTCGSNFLSQNSVQLASDSREVEITQMVSILDPTCKKTKGAPRKISKTGPLEKNTKKTKVG